MRRNLHPRRARVPPWDGVDEPLCAADATAFFFVARGTATDSTRLIDGGFFNWIGAWVASPASADTGCGDSSGIRGGDAAAAIVNSDVSAAGVCSVLCAVVMVSTWDMATLGGALVTAGGGGVRSVAGLLRGAGRLAFFGVLTLRAVDAGVDRRDGDGCRRGGDDDRSMTRAAVRLVLGRLPLFANMESMSAS